MLVLHDRPGQLCNRLWAFSPFISLALSKNIKLVILSFGEYIPLFEDLDKYPNIVFKELLGLPYPVVKVAVRFIRLMPSWVLKFLNLKIIQDEEELYQILKLDPELSGKIYLMSSWSAMKGSELDEADKLKSIFRPAYSKVSFVSELLKGYKEGGATLVGVHIRRGDYSEYKDGEYYYTDQQYYEIMKTVEAQTSGSITYLICSDESVDVEAYKGLEVFQPGSTPIEDILILSLCDYIVGPPSTFSMWASFYGRAKLFILESPDCELSMGNFSVVKKQNQLESGYFLGLQSGSYKSE